MTVCYDKLLPRIWAYCEVCVPKPNFRWPQFTVILSQSHRLTKKVCSTNTWPLLAHAASSGPPCVLALLRVLASRAARASVGGSASRASALSRGQRNKVQYRTLQSEMLCNRT